MATIGLLHDELVHIFAMFNESAYLDFRLVSKLWYDAVESSLVKNHPHLLVRARKYLSAVRLISGPRKIRSAHGYPYHPVQVLSEACLIPHCGIIKYVLVTNGPQWYARKAIDNLFRGEISATHIKAIVIFMSRGATHNKINMKLAIKHNSVEMVNLLEFKQTINMGQLVQLVEHNNPELARAVADKIWYLEYDFSRPRSQIEDLYAVNPDVIIEFVHYGEVKFLHALYDTIDHVKYAHAVKKISPIVMEYREKMRIENERAIKLAETKKMIIEDLYVRFPPKVNLQYKFEFREFEEFFNKVNWNETWGYSHVTMHDGGVLVGFKVWYISNIESDDTYNAQFIKQPIVLQRGRNDQL